MDTLSAGRQPHAKTQDFEIRPFRDQPLGAEVVGLDLGQPLDDAGFEEVFQAFARHSVLVFRNQQALTPDAHIAFSRRFGELEIHVQAKFLLAGHPEILIVSNEHRPDGEPIGLVDAGHYWHSDLSYRPEPSMGSLLHARRLPGPGIGDTLFASMSLAYETLSPAVQKRIASLSAVHDYGYRNALQAAKSSKRPTLNADQARTVPPVVHPIVRVHPVSGRRALFVNEGFTSHILGLEADASRNLLQELFAHSVQPSLIYRQQWRDGDLVMWDNRAVIHLATDCPPELARTLYRTTIKGTVPVGPDSAA